MHAFTEKSFYFRFIVAALIVVFIPSGMVSASLDKDLDARVKAT